jgi:predicted transcriptional regulator
MPFSKTKEHHSEEYWKRHFISYLKPLIQKNKRLKAYRSEPLRGDIAMQIITDLAHADVVVADLTDHNPNVLWELGVRQSFRQCTITIAEKGTEIPFHFSHKGILFYNGEHLDNQPFEKQLLDALTNCVEKPDDPDSPVLEALGGRGTLYSIIHADENKRRIDSLKLEFSINTQLLKRIYDRIAENEALRAQNKPNENPHMVTELLKYSALENLMINRYLDLEPEFYNTLSAYHSFLLTDNDCLLDWPTRAQYREKRILNNKKGLEELRARIEVYLTQLI